MIVVFLGPPGSGKGTQAKLLAKECGYLHISTGDILRKALEQETPIGQKAKKFVLNGELVPDEIMLDLIEEALRPGKVIIDGFPRTINQAIGLENMLSKRNEDVFKAVFFDISAEKVVKRMSGRLICENCGAIYHEEYRPSKTEGICDVCGGKLYKRADDNQELAIKRYKVYQEETFPVVEFYKKSEKLLTLDASKDANSLHNELKRALDGC
ncbi:MAG: nucleoside monophosphate kinase [Aquificaceae bacterium]|nr:nucleoside monophosphate kinase [Aquificaceae bacterium]